MLTEQRKRFVLEYIKLRCKNQREAAIRAGYSPKSAATQACEILKDSEVRAFLQKQKAAILREIQEDLALSASDAVSVVGRGGRGDAEPRDREAERDDQGVRRQPGREDGASCGAEAGGCGSGGTDEADGAGESGGGCGR